MTEVRELPWLRIVTEGVAIVASILLAFAIDAWWEKRAERRQSDALIASLYTDFESSQNHLDEWLNGNRKIHYATSRFLERLEAVAIGDTIVVPIDWIGATLSTPTYSPTDVTLEGAISSGQIELIDDAELRIKLTLWRQQLDDTREDEVLVRQIVVTQLSPTLADQIRLGSALEFDAVLGWFLDRGDGERDEELQIRATRQLEGQLAERIFYSTFVVNGLSDLRTTQAEILQLLATKRRVD